MSMDIAKIDAAPTSIVSADRETAAAALQHILATGDLSKLTNEQRVATYLDLCSSLSLNPRSRPFDWLVLDGKLVLYPNKSCAEQLRRAHLISVRVLRREIVGDLFVCEVEGRRPNGVTDQSSKYVPLTYWDRQDGSQKRLTGQKLADAFHKAETGAKRRLVLSMVGLASPPDPDEVAHARYVVVDGRGNVITHPTEEQRAIAADPSLARVLGEPVYEDADASRSPLSGTPSQAARPDELEHPREDFPRPTLKGDVDRWRRAWFAAVKGTSLDTDEARHQFVGSWTAEWPEGKRTDSLSTMFKRMTDREAEDCLAQVRAICEDEKRALLEEVAAARETKPRRRAKSDDVHAAVLLTGGPPDDGEGEPEQAMAF